MHDHRRTTVLAECTNMRQSGRAIPGLKQNVAFFRHFAVQLLEDGFRFFKGPCAAGKGDLCICVMHGGENISGGTEIKRFLALFDIIFHMHYYFGTHKCEICYGDRTATQTFF